MIVSLRTFVMGNQQLNIVIHFREHPFYKYEMEDVICNIPILNKYQDFQNIS